MNILLTFLSLAGALVGTSPLAHADFETIIVLYEPTFTHPLCDELMSKHLQDPTLKVEAYAYAAPTGVDFNPYGFLSSFMELPWGPKKITLHHETTVQDLELSKSEVDQARAEARAAVKKGMEGRVQSKIIEDVNAVEDTLDHQYIKFVLVRDEKTNGILGTWRTVTAYAKNGKVILPSLEIERKRHLLTEEDENELRALFGYKNENGYESLMRNIKEEGQFYISDSISAEKRAAVRGAILAWLTGTDSAIAGSNDLRIAHTSDAQHTELSARHYGFSTPISFLTKSSEGIVETVSSSTADQFYQKIRKILSR